MESDVRPERPFRSILLRALNQISANVLTIEEMDEISMAFVSPDFQVRKESALLLTHVDGSPWTQRKGAGCQEIIPTDTFRPNPWQT